MLQDRVDPRPFAETQAMLERELGAPVAELFADLEEQPCAAASLAQVAVSHMMKQPVAVARQHLP